jgi:hypothetical protein
MQEAVMNEGSDALGSLFVQITQSNIVFRAVTEEVGMREVSLCLFTSCPPLLPP